jgi:hypothetical protein
MEGRKPAMSAGLLITVYLASSLLAGTLAGAVSARKRRHHGFWTAGAFLFPPLLLLLLFLPRGNYRPVRDNEEWDDNLDRF